MVIKSLKTGLENKRKFNRRANVWGRFRRKSRSLLVGEENEILNRGGARPRRGKERYVRLLCSWSCEEEQDGTLDTRQALTEG